MSVIRKNTIAAVSDDNPLEFVFSDGSVDAYDDVIDQAGWDLTDFKRNPIALVGHNPDFPIGKWTNVRIEGGKLRGHLTLAPEGTSHRIDEVRTLVFAGILKACSVGFHPIESMPRPGAKRGGTRYLKQRLIECSVVSTPANANALLMEARALGTSAATIRVLFRQSVDASLAERQAYARNSLMRAREVIARVDERMRAEEEAAKKRKPGELGPKAQAVYEQHKARRERAQYAIPREHGRWPGEPAPSITFAGQAAFSKKNKFGW